jgi:hypothetical protein
MQRFASAAAGTAFPPSGDQLYGILLPLGQSVEPDDVAAYLADGLDLSHPRAV